MDDATWIAIFKLYSFTVFQVTAQLKRSVSAKELKNLAVQTTSEARRSGFNLGSASDEAIAVNLVQAILAFNNEVRASIDLGSESWN